MTKESAPRPPSSRVKALLQKREAEARARQEEAERASEEVRELRVEPGGQGSLDLQLPLFPEYASAMPHHWTRTTLFASIARGKRKLHHRQQLASRSDFTILYTGQQLDMADNDVFLHALQLAQNQDAGQVIHFVRSKFLEGIGRSASGQNTYAWLENSLRRLAEATLFIESDQGQGLMVRLIKDMAWNKKQDEYWLALDPHIVKFFQQSQIAYIDFEVRKKLRYALSKWLQNYACGHRAGEHHFVSIENLMHWSGSTGRVRDFAEHKERGLRVALAELESHGVIREWDIYERPNGRKKQLMVKWFRPQKTKELTNEQD
ncbi:RepB family plasmid replication initiator protein [Pseudomonas sp. LTJR-52]|uniref:plasmid replication initiator TrfA n=1 Tax=Pseudomonas TaxID=286 RepID=UPI000EFD93E3|nr:plasmid replication initiator TrfA [Pseudomonas sp. LTJR-52]AYN96621.1 RepB family plasmid replication initiator protein [Pseudomonas sp. LTJR-52]